MTAGPLPTLPDDLRQGTRSFVERNAAAIEVRLEQAWDAIERELEDYSGVEAERYLTAYDAADEAWQRFFWARLAHHRLADGLTPEQALERADEDVLSLGGLLHAL